MITTNDCIEVEKSKDGYSIIKITKDSKQVFIGSKYNNQRIIDEFINNVNDTVEEEKRTRAVFIIYGLATGEHIKELRKYYHKNVIIVFEPNKNIYELNKDKLSDLNIHIICCEIDKIQGEISRHLNTGSIGFLYNFDFANYGKIYEKECVEFYEYEKLAITSIALNRNTLLINAIEWFRTTMNNIPYYVDAVPVGIYENMYKNRPAVIVSAGPSLEKNIRDLKCAENNLLIFAGARTLKPLMINDMKPHILCSIDSKKNQYDIVKGYLEEYHGPLLFGEHSSEDVVKNHVGKKMFYTESGFMKKATGNAKSCIGQGGSVAHALTMTAILMGCNPIIFIGQDLAYTENKIYSSITKNEDKSNSMDDVKSIDDVYVDGVDGKKIRTSLSFNNFRIAFEKIVENNPETVFINATEGGARIKGTIEMPLKEAVKKYKSNIEVKKINDVKYDFDIKRGIIESLNEYKDISEMIQKKCKKALRLVEDLRVAYILKDLSKVNKILKQMDKIDSIITENKSTISLIEYLLYIADYNALTSKKVDSDNPSIKEADIILEQSRNYYNEIKNALSGSQKYIDEALEKVKNLDDMEI